MRTGYHSNQGKDSFFFFEGHHSCSSCNSAKYMFKKCNFIIFTVFFLFLFRNKYLLSQENKLCLVKRKECFWSGYKTKLNVFMLVILCCRYLDIINSSADSVHHEEWIVQVLLCSPPVESTEQLLNQWLSWYCQWLFEVAKIPDNQYD